MLPNILTIFRFILTGAFIYFLIQPGVGSKTVAIICFVVASITDFLDGYLARKWNLISNFGKIMDPIADKFLTLSAFFIFARLGVIGMWVFILIGFREIYITVLRFIAMRKKQVLAAEQMGKIKTVVQIVAIGLILLFLLLVELETVDFENIIWQKSIFIMMGVVVVLTVVSGLQNIWNNRKAYYVRKNG